MDEKLNAYDLEAQDNVTLSFIRSWLSSPSEAREFITISFYTFDAIVEACNYLESSPAGLLEAKVYTGTMKLTRRAVGEMSLSSVLYTSGADARFSLQLS
ncbi:hypothetical protein [Bacteroides sp. 519]|uniref:hypothetical protein n=1 Tax=Bacteroides sp. 519 TaxID=2302937 RepID=UPI0013CFC3AB|nr:hypothetical protein [Bacteroides sp. 519]NDV59325.1 hypothetical protein [Bacteroides sp. 519]